MKSIKNLEVTGFARYIRISPSKVRRILDQIRGRSCNEALLLLNFLPYRSCSVIAKLINSVVSNAKVNYGLVDKSFFISQVWADPGPILKRFCPHAQGRGFPIKKRMSHIVSFVCN